MGMIDGGGTMITKVSVGGVYFGWGWWCFEVCETFFLLGVCDWFLLFE
jgi:hypothetical protein